MGALAAPNTANTVPEETLLAFANHSQIGKAMPRDGGDSEQVLVSVARAGIDVAALPKNCRTRAPRALLIPGRTSANARWEVDREFKCRHRAKGPLFVAGSLAPGSSPCRATQHAQSWALQSGPGASGLAAKAERTASSFDLGR
jgi:hypothetical protein